MVSGATTRVWSAAVIPTKRWGATVVQPDPELATGDTPLADLEDAALVAQTVAGCREAFDVIVERHRRTVYSVCYRFTGNHEDASDLAQDVFVRAWRGLGRFKGQSAFTTWLYRIAVNVCLNRVSAKTVTLEPLQSDRFVDTHAEDPGAGLLELERAAAVRHAIATLPRKQRATLILRAYHELSHKQIAEILGSSVGAVKANFFHALGNLKKALGSEP